MGTTENEQFCKLLYLIRKDYGSEIVFDPKRLRNILSDLNLQYKNEETKFMFLINEHQSFVKSILNQGSVTEEAVFGKIENLCGFNRIWTENVARALFTIAGMRYDATNDTWIVIEKVEESLEKPVIVQRDNQLSFDDYLQMAIDGDAEAQLKVADSYYYGRDVKRDYEQAFYWYQRIAASSDSYVWEQMGVCYYFGYGTDKNYSKAIKWLEKAANDNRAFSQACLGYCFYLGQGVSLDYTRAFHLFQRAANNNNTWSMSLIGDCYYYGRGVDKDLSEAFKWYEKSAQNNWSYSQAILGRCYYNGEGVPLDYEKALYWYKKSADNNNAWGMSLLGDYYYDGKALDTNYSMAIVWYEKAANKNNVWAMKQLGLMYCNGNGCQCDYDTAIIWLEKAALAGNEKAKDLLQQLKMCLPINDSSVKPALCAKDIIYGVWGPEREVFTWERPSTYIIFNSICDNPLLGNERNFVRIKKEDSEEVYGDEINVSAGFEYIVLIYYHNNISSFSHKIGLGVAHGVRLSVAIPERIDKGETGTVRSGLYSTEARPNFIWDSVLLKASEDVRITYVENTACIHNSGTAEGTILPKDELFGKGALISYDIDHPGSIPSIEDESKAYIELRIRCEKNRIEKTINYDSGTVYVGETLNGQIDGFGRMTFSDGNMYEGYFSNGKRNGKGKFTWKSGAFYEGLWVNDLREDEHGYQKYADGSVYVGGWKAGKRNGSGTYTLGNGRVYEGQWENDKQIGNGKISFTVKSGYDGGKIYGNGVHNIKSLNNVKQILSKAGLSTDEIKEYEAIADYFEGKKWLQQHLPNYRAFIGYEMTAGEVCEENGKLEEAFEHYKKAADLGDAKGAFYVGYMCERGEGVHKDIEEAFSWYNKAAKMGNRGAQHNLGVFYYNGISVRQDYKLAYEYFMMSADQGKADSMLNIGVMFENGQYVKKDYQKALAWYQKASDYGNTDAAQYYNALNAKIK